MDETQLSQNSVAELKEMLRSKGLPVSGRKADLIARLSESSSETKQILDGAFPSERTVNLEDEEEQAGDLTFKQRLGVQVYGPLNVGALIAIAMAVIMVTATILVFKPTWLGFERQYDYELIDFDQDQTRNFAQDLVNLGHPDWEGRMSGTIEETNTSQYILGKLQDMGYTPENNEFQVPMHHVNSEPSFRLCVRGVLGDSSPCEGFFAAGSQVTPFQHRSDYVIQGFSGQS
ncbi:SAP domain-containing protein, partial [Euryarchaeota archaeon]|nr:SAP domain-containing protein [Euryarchaeota archaeon]